MSLNKRLLVIGILLLSIGGALLAQEPQGAGATAPKDSVVYRLASNIDSTLVGKSIFSLMPSHSRGDKGNVIVNQSRSMSSALASHIAANSSRKLTGYRVRIYFDNRQDSRAVSLGTMGRFRSLHPGIPAYHNYQAPFFKVTVGNFRTKSEAMELLLSIKSEFPTAFVVREGIEYPAADREHTYYTETIRVPAN